MHPIMRAMLHGAALSALLAACTTTPPDTSAADARDVCATIGLGSHTLSAVRHDPLHDIPPEGAHLIAFGENRAPVLWTRTLQALSDVAFLDADDRLFHVEPGANPKDDTFLAPHDRAGDVRHILVVPQGGLDDVDVLDLPLDADIGRPRPCSRRGA